MFVANFNGNSVTEYARRASGNVAPIADISGPATGLSGPAGIWVDASGHLFVANFNANSVTEYARGASGNVAPVADISGSATGVNVPGAVAADARGHVFVANFNGNSVTEYARRASGNVAPIADISRVRHRAQRPRRDMGALAWIHRATRSAVCPSLTA